MAALEGDTAYVRVTLPIRPVAADEYWEMIAALRKKADEMGFDLLDPTPGTELFRLVRRK